jgi:hypothetical protein
MSVFGRNLGTSESRELRALEQLRVLTESIDDNWWKDLLRLWRPAGYDAGDSGLRLSVRNGYLNFYLRGQSVARVGFRRNGAPFAETHIKYATSNEKEKDQAYIRLVGREFFRSGQKLEMRYKPESTVNRWISRADNWGRKENDSGEKVLVDEAVAANGSIIDLEMGLPSWDGSKTARRMDLVLLEKTSGQLWIVFWEAKTISDSRLASTNRPEVLTQLKYYRDYLADPKRAGLVKSAYRKNCAILTKLHDLAKEIHPKIEPLNSLIVEAAQVNDSELDVCLEPRLAVFDDQDGKRTAHWKEHEQKLRACLKQSLRVFEGSNYVLC